MFPVISFATRPVTFTFSINIVDWIENDTCFGKNNMTLLFSFCHMSQICKSLLQTTVLIQQRIFLARVFDRNYQFMNDTQIMMLKSFWMYPETHKNSYPMREDWSTVEITASEKNW